MIPTGSDWVLTAGKGAKEPSPFGENHHWIFITNSSNLSDKLYFLNEVTRTQYIQLLQKNKTLPIQTFRSAQCFSGTRSDICLNCSPLDYWMSQAQISFYTDNDTNFNLHGLITKAPLTQVLSITVRNTERKHKRKWKRYRQSQYLTGEI